MSLQMSANRYAKALFAVALDEKTDLVQVERDLAVFAEVLDANAELLQVATRAGIPDATRKAVAASVADKLALVTPVKKLVALLAEQRKLNLLPNLLAAYGERLLSHQNVVRAEVTSAAALTPEKTAALEASLGRATGKKVELSVAVDPELLGGVVARIGSTVYDGSVRTQLTKMRQQLVEK